MSTAAPEKGPTLSDVAETRLNPDQRAELHRTIWRMANDLRGSVDGWDFKRGRRVRT